MKVATLISDFKRQGYYKIKVSIQLKDITMTNTYALNIGTPNYIQQMLTSIKWKFTVTQKSRGLQHSTYINEHITQTENQQGNTGLKFHIRSAWELIDIQKIFHPKTSEYILFKSILSNIQDSSQARPQNKSQ